MTMPTYERRYFVNKLSEEFDKRAKEYEKRKNKK